MLCHRFITGFAPRLQMPHRGQPLRRRRRHHEQIPITLKRIRSQQSAVPATLIGASKSATNLENLSHCQSAAAESMKSFSLPPSWRIVRRVRTSGSTAGRVDTFYYHPVTNRRYRSKKAVKRFLEAAALTSNTRETFEASPNSYRKRSRKGKAGRSPLL